MKFPMRIKHRRKVLAVIYGKSKAFPAYRVAWNVAGKRMQKRFRLYAEAKKHADDLVKELAKGSEVTALTPAQANDAIAAMKALHEMFKDTGKRITLHEAASQFSSATRKLGDRTLADAVDGFLSTVAVVKRKPLAEAVTEFIEGRKHLSESTDGKRPKHSPVYESNVSMWLNEFARTLPGNIVCDLSKTHLDAYIDAFKKLSAKSRNDRRAVVRMFLRWSVAKDFLSPHHRLLEAVGFRTETVEITEIDFYRPNELRAMLDRASKVPAPAKDGEEQETDFRDVVPVIALGGQGGIRREEIMRLDWQKDVWHVPGKVEIGARIAKGRKRRLVSICPALNAWLRPYRKSVGPVWGKSADVLEERLAALRDELGIPARRNGLRHAFVTFHFAMYSDENLTAAESGNSPQMLHEHYRGLATKAEAKKYFAVAPAKAGNVIALKAEQAG